MTTANQVKDSDSLMSFLRPAPSDGDVKEWLDQVTGSTPAGQRLQESAVGAVETITERSSLGGKVSVDSVRGIIRGVKILGRESKNGREYASEAVGKAASLYEGAKVNINHPSNPNQPRDYRDRLGHLASVQNKGGELFGDLHFNPKHPLAEQLAWDAEHAPENVGLSHNVEAVVNRKSGKVVVEEIRKVLSVDVVADPATTRGLYEQDDKKSDGPTGLGQHKPPGASDAKDKGQPADDEAAKQAGHEFAKLADEYQRWMEMAAALAGHGERRRKFHELLAEFARKAKRFDDATLNSLDPSADKPSANKPDEAKEHVQRLLRDAGLDGTLGAATTAQIVEHIRRGDHAKARAIVDDYARLGGRKNPFSASPAGDAKGFAAAVCR